MLMSRRKPTPETNGQVQVQAVSIDDVHADPANARLHPERNKATIRASLARFGPGRSIVLDGNNVVRAGNGTIEEARQAGFDEVLIVEPKANQLVAVKRADWSATEAAAYSVSDNRSAEQAEWDDTALASTLRALQSEEFDLAATGYTGDEVQGLIDRLAGEIVDDPQGEWEGMPEFDHEDQTEEAAFTIGVYLKDEADLAEFGKLLGQDLTGRKYVWFSKKPQRTTVETMDA